MSDYPAGDMPALTTSSCSLRPLKGGACPDMSPPSHQGAALGDDEVAAEVVARKATALEEIAELCATDPLLSSIPVRTEILEVAEEIASSSDVIGIERTNLLFLVRAIVYLDRQRGAS